MRRSAWLFCLLFASAFFTSARASVAQVVDSEARVSAMSPSEVRQFEIEVLRKIADLGLIPPKINTSPVPQFDYDKLDYGMTPGITRTPKGRL